MKKLVEGILDFRRKLQPSQRETFARLALGQRPDALYIGCSDSRVAVNVFASTDPGDLFVNRNIGNIVPRFRGERALQVDSVSGAIEFALLNLQVRYIIVCGHSECGAMIALTDGLDKIKAPAVRSWLSNSEDVVVRLETEPTFAPHLKQHNRLSQMNVLCQIDHLKTYPLVRERLEAGQLTILGWWFEIAKAEVYSFDDSSGHFVLIDETEGNRILDRIKPHER